MLPTDRLARIVSWLERQGRWVASSDLHRWQQANLGSSRAKRAHDVRALVQSSRVERSLGPNGRYQYRSARRADTPVIVPAHVLARIETERRLVEACTRRACVVVPLHRGATR